MIHFVKRGLGCVFNDKGAIATAAIKVARRTSAIRATMARLIERASRGSGTQKE
jgi:hypothetical protein